MRRSLSITLLASGCAFAAYGCSGDALSSGSDESNISRPDEGDVRPGRDANPDSLTSQDIARLNQQYATTRNPNHDRDFARALVRV